MRAERWAARGIKAALGVGGERVALRGRARWAAAREGWGRVRARPCQRLCGGASTEAIVGTLHSPQYAQMRIVPAGDDMKRIWPLKCVEQGLQQAARTAQYKS